MLFVLLTNTRTDDAVMTEQGKKNIFFLLLFFLITVYPFSLQHLTPRHSLCEYKLYRVRRCGAVVVVGVLHIFRNDNQRGEVFFRSRGPPPYARSVIVIYLTRSCIKTNGRLNKKKNGSYMKFDFFRKILLRYETSVG